MLFNSFEFAIFFAAFLSLFFSAPKSARPVVMLIASYIFYAAWRPSFLLLLLLTTVVDYTTAIVIDTARKPLLRKIALATALSVNLGILFSVKYLDFMLASFVGAAGFVGVEIPPLALNLILPIGISFYTFQSVGYTLDVYNRVFPAERNLLFYSLYVAFFPQLVAGPIERASHMLRQYRNWRPTTPDRIGSGLWLCAWGLFKKMCVADVVAPFVNGVYASPGSFDGSYTLLASVFFALQIYCDFSGYSDMAIGIARIIGVDLMTNFRQPYFASSLTDFWRRWHISLSTWFRDYLYIPLGGNRTTRPKWARNTLIVFGVSGLWHGANWTFLIWGLWHGAAIVAEDLFRRMKFVARRKPLAVGAEAATVTVTDVRSWHGRLGNVVGVFYTLAIVLVGWVFFRARDVPDAVHILKSWTSLGDLSYGTFKILGIPSVELVVLVANLALLIVVDGVLANKASLLRSLGRKPWASTTAAVLLAYNVILWGAFGSFDFIYFQF
ncbi:MBOAT family O-acyltransferase [Methylocella sp.]|uniref:MBOAT family O-acyltransferase n=1 Tax=Methylocella sp. TaxID=1978226 RepID=UPI003783E6E8